MIARNVSATGTDAALVADQLAALAAPDLKLAIVFADWRLDPATLARRLQAACGSAPVVGCTTIGVIGGPHDAGAEPGAVAVGLYGDWLRVGIGVATEVPSGALARSRDAVHAAAAALGLTADKLDPSRHVALTMLDGLCGHPEAFCIGSAATAPQIRFVGGCAATAKRPPEHAYVWARGEALADAGVVVVLDSQLPFEAVISSHLVATELKTVVTASSFRTIEELDGRPAAARLREMAAQLGGTVEEGPPEYAFARFVDGVPYVRSMTRVDGTRIHVASAVEPGHVLRLMRTGSIIDQTQRDLAVAAERLDGNVSALLAFDCVGRHGEARARGIAGELADAYAKYPTTGLQSYGEQIGMLLVNHSLAALAIGGT